MKSSKRLDLSFISDSVLSIKGEDGGGAPVALGKRSQQARMKSLKGILQKKGIRIIA